MLVSTLHAILARTASSGDYTEFMGLIKDLHAIHGGYDSWADYAKDDETAESSWDLVLAPPNEINLRLAYDPEAGRITLSFVELFNGYPHCPTDMPISIDYDNDDIIDVMF